MEYYTAPGNRALEGRWAATSMTGKTERKEHKGHYGDKNKSCMGNGKPFQTHLRRNIKEIPTLLKGIPNALLNLFTWAAVKFIRI